MNQSLSYEIPGVMAAALATGLFVSLCTIQKPDATFGPSGAPSNTYVDVAGLVNIACMTAVPSDARIQATEAKDLEEIQAKGFRHVTLNGYYANVLTGWRDGWRAIVDGVAYDIIGAESDSQNTQTRIMAQLVTV